MTTFVIICLIFLGICYAAAKSPDKDSMSDSKAYIPNSKGDFQAFPTSDYMPSSFREFWDLQIEAWAEQTGDTSLGRDKSGGFGYEEEEDRNGRLVTKYVYMKHIFRLKDGVDRKKRFAQIKKHRSKVSREVAKFEKYMDKEGL